MRRTLLMLSILMIILFSYQFVYGQCDFPDYLESESWDDVSLWESIPKQGCTIEVLPYSGCNEDGIEIYYSLLPDTGWVIMRKDSISGYSEDNPIVLLIKAKAYSDMELKFVDEDGTVFGKRYSIEDRYDDWTSIVIYLDDTKYWWGGDSTFHNLESFEIAFSAGDSGHVWIDEIGIGKQGLLTGLFLDPYRILEGIGFKQRRHEYMIQEDSLVIEYLKAMQDASPNDSTVGSYYGDDSFHTFDNSLVAIAFILKKEMTRAKRILDFYANAIDTNNTEIRKQNFYYRPTLSDTVMMRGFYQRTLFENYFAKDSCDRWIGDMAWLYLAFKLYDNESDSDMYLNIRSLIVDLFLRFYKDEGDCGYIMTGWQKLDSEFDSTGHYEGNIDCYAVLKDYEEEEKAQEIKKWLDKELDGKNDLPLDLYSWRVLAYGKGYESILNIPEYDFRYRKIMEINSDSLMGFFTGPNIEVDNIWVEGTAHMACAFLVYGDTQRGYFYANQLDLLLIENIIDGKLTHTLPYVVNRTGGFSGVDTAKGSVSAAAWYIIAKNELNPMDPPDPSGTLQIPRVLTLYQNCLNPFNLFTKISYSIPNSDFVTLKVYDIIGREIKTLVNEVQKSGEYSINFDASGLSSGIYFYRLQVGKNFTDTKKMLLLR